MLPKRTSFEQRTYQTYPRRPRFSKTEPFRSAFPNRFLIVAHKSSSTPFVDHLQLAELLLKSSVDCSDFGGLSQRISSLVEEFPRCIHIVQVAEWMLCSSFRAPSWISVLPTFTLAAFVRIRCFFRSLSLMLDLNASQIWSSNTGIHACRGCRSKAGKLLSPFTIEGVEQAPRG